MQKGCVVNTKSHYLLLDGLRGVAALLVVWYHIFEGFATSPVDQRFNHGYLAVDFFFILSGFVVGYAYDDRWKQGAMSSGQFFRRRLIRLHPMVAAGVVLGVVSFLLQGSVQWDGTPVPAGRVLLAALLGLLMLPALPGSAPEVRGNAEMFPLNGPMWSLFFEYLANIGYALFLRRLSTKALAVWTAGAGVLLAVYALGNGSGSFHLGVGWSLSGMNLPGGLLRVGFAFSAGLLMNRLFRAPRKWRGVFWLCSGWLALLLCVPYVGGPQPDRLNAVYDVACVTLFFPLLVWLGASGMPETRLTERVCRFLGGISYPLYAVHYPFAYLFYAWLWQGDVPVSFGEAWPRALLLFFGCIVLARVLQAGYDGPVRRWLSVRADARSGKE